MIAIVSTVAPVDIITLPPLLTLSPPPRVASSRLESSPPRRPLFWSQYWGGRAPHPRDAYRREGEEYREPWREGGNALKLRSAGGREGGSWLALAMAVLVGGQL